MLEGPAGLPADALPHLPRRTGELADIAGGDAWDHYREDDLGQSYILARTGWGAELLERAVAAGYLTIVGATAKDVIRAQGLVEKRRHLFGRILGMRLLGVPVPRYRGFHLMRAWLPTSIPSKLRTTFGTVRRVLLRGLWYRNPPFQGLSISNKT